MAPDAHRSGAEAPARLTLFCLPHAGGSAAYYTGFGRQFPPGIRFHPLELPGHGRRCKEPPATTLEAMVADLCGSIAPVVHTAPYAIFGHSLGALLAFLCAARAHASGQRLPEALFLSACLPPAELAASFAGQRPLHSAADAWQHAREIGGIPADIAGSGEFRAYLEPILYADFTALRAWRPPEFPPLPVPLVALLGDRDTIAVEKANRWRHLSTAGFALQTFAGDHFYLRDHGPDAAAFIARTLEAAGTLVTNRVVRA